MKSISFTFGLLIVSVKLFVESAIVRIELDSVSDEDGELTIVNGRLTEKLFDQISAYAESLFPTPETRIKLTVTSMDDPVIEFDRHIMIKDDAYQEAVDMLEGHNVHVEACELVFSLSDDAEYERHLEDKFDGPFVGGAGSGYREYLGKVIERRNAKPDARTPRFDHSRWVDGEIGLTLATMGVYL